ncbi:MAG: hypothetical protein PSX81_04125 [bacterium]|nr:hypothetical protein [bacterium]
MIQFENNSSPHYAANQAYCNSIADQLMQFKATCQGFCNSYGFDINATWQQEDLTFSIECRKYQTTQNGIVIPVNSHLALDTIIKIRGLNKDYKLQIGPSSIKRWFSNKQWQLYLPRPYFISTNYAPPVEDMKIFSKQIIDLGLTTLQMNHGKLRARINNATTDVVSLVKNMEQLVKPWR